jgi:ppGpp synthetase/RelA/SpoT-type nucleotidyltranferase
MTSPYEDAQIFITQHGERYGDLLRLVRSTCERVGELELQSVKTVYSRGKKQKNASELKETWKLPKKLVKMRLNQEKDAAADKVSPPISWRDLPDVVGVTVVVYYPDQIQTILKRVLFELFPQGISLDGQIQEKTEFGYHAYHAVVVSTRGPHMKLRCEIQCKTMLHDSWATKMHDLTYKPMGYLEPRLELLMQAFGDTLERVERQSQAIRDMIFERWNAEAERRRVTHSFLFSSLSGALQREDLSAEAKELRALIEREQAAIGQAANADDGLIGEIRTKIDSLCANNLEEGWVLAALIASFRPKPDLVTFLAIHADAWLEEVAAAVQTGRITQDKGLNSVPLAFVSAGNFDLAIDCYVRLLAAPDRYALDKPAIGLCKYNYANALIERHYYEPDENRDGSHEEFRQKVTQLLKEVENARVAQENESLQAAEALANANKEEVPAGGEASAEQKDARRRENEASANDTQGFLLISLGTTPEEVSSGIDLCNSARHSARKHGMLLGERYCDFHLRLGWRKLMELEAQHPKDLAN